ncbi:MAG: hypothetical protein ABR540_21635 [Acidimicrobiales bacterium]|nr:hypothetical protein [Actinomycetota bacterium]
MELILGTPPVAVVRADKVDECTGRASVTVRANEPVNVFFRWYFHPKQDPSRKRLVKTNVHGVEPSGTGRNVVDAFTFAPSGDDLLVEFSTSSRPTKGDLTGTSGAACG